jgi:hypothetical protein
MTPLVPRATHNNLSPCSSIPLTPHCHTPIPVGLGGSSSFGLLDDLHSFDPVNMTWTLLSTGAEGSPPSARFEHGFASAEGKLYVFGGCGFVRNDWPQDLTDACYGKECCVGPRLCIWGVHIFMQAWGVGAESCENAPFLRTTAPPLSQTPPLSRQGRGRVAGTSI